MILVVLDSNVIASGLMSVSSTPGNVLGRWAEGAFSTVVTNELLSEYERSLSYPRIRSRILLDDADLRAWLRLFRQQSVLVAPAAVPPTVIADADDDRVLACAVSGSASYIVTGDKHLLGIGTFQGIEVVTPARFLSVLERES